MTAPIVRLVQARHYRSLQSVTQSLRPFQVLVGPNGSGKSTFLDVIAFLGDLIRGSVLAAIEGDVRLGIGQRAPDGKQLTWMRREDSFELAIEAVLPQDRVDRLGNGKFPLCRYEVAIDVTGPTRITVENLWLRPAPSSRATRTQCTLFPADPSDVEKSIVRRPRQRNPEKWKKVLARGEEPEKVIFYAETSGWNNPFRLSADRTALASLPDDEERFPAATWFRQFLSNGVQRLVLSSEAMRRPSLPGRWGGYLPDGSNLPHVVHRLETQAPQRMSDWIKHLGEALPDLEHITSREREEDRSRYLVLRHRSGLEVPSWLISDGTLRLLALTLLAYAPEIRGVLLIEEPENGLHPRAVETVVQSLCSVYDAQVLLATHSPLIVSSVQPQDILCFARTENRATDIVAGDQHPQLRDWRRQIDLGTLLASGVLE